MDNQVKAKQEKLAKRFIKKTEAYQKIFNTIEGREVLGDLMAAHYVNGPTFSQGIKPMDLAHREGERNVVLRILKLLNTNTKDLRERIEEHERAQAD